jgi:hypothetical protein
MGSLDYVLVAKAPYLGKTGAALAAMTTGQIEIVV